MDRFEYRVLESLLTHTHSLKVTNCWSSVQAESVTDTVTLALREWCAFLCRFPCLSDLLVWFLKTDGLFSLLRMWVG